MSHLQRIVRLCLMLFPLVLAVTWMTARRAADRQVQAQRAAERRRDAEDRKRAGTAVTACKYLCIAAIQHAAEHQDHLPPADRWETALRPYLKGVSLEIAPALDGTHRRFAMNRALSGKDTNHLNITSQIILFYESTAQTPNAADNLTSLPPQEGASGFAVGWADGHCYYRDATDRADLIQESTEAQAGKG